jgi:hypothetical protein
MPTLRIPKDQNDSNPLPRPTLEQVLVMQAQMLKTMQQTMVNMQHNQRTTTLLTRCPDQP